jgi:MoaA/NifB/PqqE/SkfB family radical SAM enzyme
MSDLKTYNVRSIHLEVTGKCNLNCKYCYNSKFNEKKMIETEMSTEDVKRLIREASDMGCDNFKFS